jgi:hypothetical protein
MNDGRLAFGSPTETWRAYDIAVDSVFGVDIILKCFLAYTDKKDYKLMTEPWAILKNYLRLLKLASD